MKLAILSGVVLLLTVCGIATGSAAPRGSEVIIIYNKKLPDSKEVAEYYAQKRNVPKEQVFGFDLSTSEEISRAEFRDELQRPLAKALSSKKLWRIASEVQPATTNAPSTVMWRVKESKIRYAVVCYGVPLRVKSDPTLREQGLDKLKPEMRRDEACVDSELAVLPLIEQRPPLAGPLRNILYTTTNTAWLHPTNGLLLVGRVDGPSAQIAKGLIDKALQAERDGLWGRAYFDIRSTTDPGMKQGDEWIGNAAELCRRLGFETYVDKGPDTIPAGFPVSQVAYYLGWYAQNVTGPFAEPTIEFMPGAFAYHLHSFSALTLRSTNQGWVGPFLAKGVTATMGTVQEPYLAGTPDVAVFTSRFIYFGMSYGEAAWASQPVLSWQTTVVGDPLYRPFGGNPEEIHDRFMRERNPLVNWSFLRLVNLNFSIGKKLDEIVGFLESLGPLTNSAVLSEKLGELYAEQGKPSSSIHAYESALKLNPTPQQAIRLRLILGEKLVAAGEREKARAVYEKLLEEAPSFANKETVQTRIAQLKGSDQPQTKTGSP